MARVSVLIPSRNERFMPETAADILKKARGDIQLIIVLEGYWPNPMPIEDPRIILIHHSVAKGLRAANNVAAAAANGEYLMKIDAHSMVSEGFDVTLQKDCADNEIVIPRRYSLNAETWTIKPDRPAVDYHYLTCPLTNKDGFSMHGQDWRERRLERIGPEYDIDDNPSFQGSCWFMTRTHFLDHLGGMSEVGYGTFCQEPQEIGNKTWLGPWGGRVVVNKKVWYAHLHKGAQYGRGYTQGKSEILAGHNYSGNHWMYNQWKERAHDFEWLIEKFPNMPTWPADWREQLEHRKLSA